MAEKWPKDFSRPKKGKKCGFWPQKIFQPNWSKNGRKMAKIRYLGPKRFKNVVIGPPKKFSQIGQKMTKIRFLGPKKVKNVVFGPKKIFSQIGQKIAEI